MPSQPFDIFADLSHKNYLKVNENCDFLQEKKNPTFSQAISGHTQDLEDALQFCSGTFDSGKILYHILYFLANFLSIFCISRWRE